MTANSLNSVPQIHHTKDYLGNIRNVLAKKDGVVQELQHTAYYPFGGIIADLSSGRGVQNRFYNGKELDYANNLYWLDYGARQYDPTRGQFTTPDPLAEIRHYMNPYVYCGNNPIDRFDPDGRDYWSTSDPKEIAAFIASYERGKTYEYSNWTHASDADFLANLSYNDKSGNYLYSYGIVENGEFICQGVIFNKLRGPIGIGDVNNFAGGGGIGFCKLKEATIGNNMKFYGLNGKRSFYGNQYIKTCKTVPVGANISRYCNFLTSIMAAYEGYTGYVKDGEMVGKNATKALVKNAFSWGAAWAGGKFGAELGSYLSPGWGTVIGGGVGAFCGGFLGGDVANWINENYME